MTTIISGSHERMAERQLFRLLLSCNLCLVCLIGGAGAADKPEQPTSVCTNNADWHTLNGLLASRGSTSCHRMLWNDTASGGGGGGMLIGGLLINNILNTSTYRCQSPTDPRRIRLTVQLTEAFLFAVETIRNASMKTNPELARALRGVEIRDTCAESHFAVAAALQMAKRSRRAEELCNASRSEPLADVYKRAQAPPPTTPDPARVCEKPDEYAEAVDRVAVVIGPGISRTLEVTSPALGVFNIPHITYWATSAKFEDKLQFPFLFRTVPSDRFQAQAMADLLVVFKWKYVYALASDDLITGGRGLQHFRDAVRDIGNSYCVAYEAQFHNADVPKMMQIARRVVLGRNEGRNRVFSDPRVVMLFCGFEYAKALFQTINSIAEVDPAFADAVRLRPLVWIASDGWIGQAPSLLYGEGSYTSNHTVLGFAFKVPSQFVVEQQDFASRLQEHFEQLRVTPESIMRNPWLGLLWQLRDNCELPFTVGHCKCGAGDGFAWKCCNTSRSAAEVFGLGLNNVAPPLSSGALWLAADAAVRAVNKLVAATKCWRPAVSSAAVHGYLKDVESTCLNATSRCTVFSSSQDVQAMYTITSVRSDPATSRPSSYTVGSWSQGAGIRFACNGCMALDHSCVRWMSGETRPPTSVCSEPCRSSGQRFHAAEDLTRPSTPVCCWQCFDCTGNTVSNSSTSPQCTNCTYRSKADAARSGCEPVVEIHAGFRNPMSMVVLATSVFGIVAAVLALVALVMLRHQPDIVETGLPLNFALLVTVMCAYAVSISLLVEPSPTYCVLSTILAATSIVSMASILIARSLRAMYLDEERNMIENRAKIALRSAANSKSLAEPQARKTSEVGQAGTTPEVGEAAPAAQDSQAGPAQDSRCERVVCRILLRLAKLFGSTMKRQLTFCIGMTITIGIGFHGCFQAIKPHNPMVLNYTETVLHAVCENTAYFQLLSSFVLVLLVVIMCFTTYRARRMISWDENDRLKSASKPSKTNTEGRLLMFAGYSVLGLYVALLPTFFVTIRLLWPVIIGLTLNLQGLAIFLCMLVPRIYRQRKTLKNVALGRKEPEPTPARRWRATTAAPAPDAQPSGVTSPPAPAPDAQSGGVTSPAPAPEVLSSTVTLNAPFNIVTAAIPPGPPQALPTGVALVIPPPQVQPIEAIPPGPPQAPPAEVALGIPPPQV